MRFEISEQIRTPRDRGAAVVNALEMQLRKVSRKVERSGDVLTASAIEASFGSINRFDRSVIQIHPKDAGFLCVADVTYRPSAFFWIFFVIGLFAYFLLWWPPIIFYLFQRKTVRSAISDVFARVKNEFEMDAIPLQPAVKTVVGYYNGCGAALQMGSRFCSSCGATLEPQQKLSVRP
jgi:hypothetical protein